MRLHIVLPVMPARCRSQCSGSRSAILARCHLWRAGPPPASQPSSHAPSATTSRATQSAAALGSKATTSPTPARCFRPFATAQAPTQPTQSLIPLRGASPMASDPVSSCLTSTATSASPAPKGAPRRCAGCKGRRCVHAPPSSFTVRTVDHALGPCGCAAATEAGKESSWSPGARPGGSPAAADLHAQPRAWATACVPPLARGAQSPWRGCPRCNVHRAAPCPPPRPTARPPRPRAPNSHPARTSHAPGARRVARPPPPLLRPGPPRPRTIGSPPRSTTARIHPHPPPRAPSGRSRPPKRPAPGPAPRPWGPGPRWVKF
jgi:hypothetical protein